MQAATRQLLQGGASADYDSGVRFVVACSLVKFMDHWSASVHFDIVLSHSSTQKGSLADTGRKSFLQETQYTLPVFAIRSSTCLQSPSKSVALLLHLCVQGHITQLPAALQVGHLYHHCALHYFGIHLPTDKRKY